MDADSEDGQINVFTFVCRRAFAVPQDPLRLNCIHKSLCSIKGKMAQLALKRSHAFHVTPALGPQLFDGNTVFESTKFCIPRPSCLRLLVQLLRLAASRAACTAGNRRPTRTPMIAMTTSSSTKVNARWLVKRFLKKFMMIVLPQR